MDSLPIVKRDIACAVVWSADERLLLAQKRKDAGGVWEDCWHIPGGGAEPGESLEQAVIRELREETSLFLAPDQISLIDDEGSGQHEKWMEGRRVMADMRFFVFLAKLGVNADQSGAKAGDDLCSLSWFRQPELKGLKLVPAGYGLFSRLGYI